MATFKIIDAVSEKDEDKTIERTEQVEQKESFTIGHLKNEIEMIDSQIANFEVEKTKIQAKIDETVTSLKLSIEE